MTPTPEISCSQLKKLEPSIMSVDVKTLRAMTRHWDACANCREDTSCRLEAAQLRRLEESR